jgi:aldehyde:ferredoxin oxidoreductase
MYDFPALFRSGSPVDNHRGVGDLDTARALYGPELYLANVLKKRIACPSCPIGDKEILELTQGEFRGCKSFGSGLSVRLAVQLGIEDMERSVMAQDILQRYGIDLHSFTGMVTFLIELYERGIITKEDTDGLAIERGFNATRELARKIAFREGIGDTIADGIPAIAERFGQECLQYAVHNKLIPETSSPKMTRFGVLQLSRVSEPRGGTGKAGMMNPGKFDPNASIDSFNKYARRIAISEEAIDRVIDPSGCANIGRVLRHAQEFYSVFSCLGVCIRIHVSDFYSMDTLAELYTAATGIAVTPAELKKAGERAWNMNKSLAVRQGFTRKEDKCPPRWLEPAHGKEGIIETVDQFGRPFGAEEFERALDDYYDECGWELERGIPTREKLLELGLEDVARNLEKADILR